MFNWLKKDKAALSSKRIGPRKKRDKVISHPAFKALVFLNICGAIYAGYLYVNKDKIDSENRAVYSDKSLNQFTSDEDAKATNDVASLPPSKQSAKEPKPTARPTVKQNDIQVIRTTPPATPAQTLIPSEPLEQKTTARAVNNSYGQKSYTEPKSEIREETSSATGTVYTVTGRDVHFHNSPDENTRRNAFINRWNKAVLRPLDEENGFVYIVYKNHWGQVSKGWLPKKELTPLNK